MTYTGDGGTISAVYRPVADVPKLNSARRTVEFNAPGSVTNGQFGLFRWDMRPLAGGPDAHFHRTFSESFYILSGTVRLFNGEKWADASAGDFLYVPEGGVHGFKNESDDPASMLILFAPAPPREKFFTELAEMNTSGRQLTHEEWTEFMASHDQYMV